VAAEILGRRMHHQVESEFDRALQDRRGKGVVDHRNHAQTLEFARRGSQIDHPQQGVGRGLDPGQPGSLTHQSREVLGTTVPDGKLEAVGFQQTLDQVGGATVQAVEQDGVFARPHQTEKYRADRTHARGGHQRGLGALQRSDARGHHAMVGRIHVARIAHLIVAAVVERGRGDDRRVQPHLGRPASMPGMDAERGKVGAVIRLRHMGLLEFGPHQSTLRHACHAAGEIARQMTGFPRQ